LAIRQVHEKTRCSEIVVIQTERSALTKTNKRDADALGALLWNNRKRLQGGQRPNSIRCIFPADPADAQVRQLAKRAESSKEKMADVYRLKAIPGISAMGAITLLSRIGDIKRFKNPDSLANYFGLTPGCHNTGGKHRIGGITKRGNAIANQRRGE